MAAEVGNVVVRVGSDITSLKQGMTGGSKSVSSFSKASAKQLREVTNNLAKVGVAAAAAGAALVAGLYTKGAQAIDAQAKLARSVGSTVVSIQTLERAANLAGIGQESMGKSAAKLNQRIGEAMRGTGMAVKQFDALGISAKELEGMEADQRLALISDRMVALKYSSSQAADALRDFGIREEKVVGLMLEGGDAFRSARKDVHDFGLAVSDVDAAKVEAANDAMTAIGVTMQTVANTVAIELSPYIQEIGQRFGNASKESGGFKSEVQSLISSSLMGFGKFADVLQGLRVVFKGLELIAVGFGAAVISSAQVSLEAFAKLDEGVTWVGNKIIAAANALGANIKPIDPFANSPFMEGLRELGNAARNHVGVVRAEMHELAMQEMPSDKVAKYLLDVAEKSKEAAASVVESRNQMMAAAGVGSGEGGKDYSDIDSQLQTLRDRFKSEQELLIEKYAVENELLNTALAAQRVTEYEHYLLQQALAQEHHGALNAIEKEAADRRTQIAEMEAQAKKEALGKALSDLTVLMNTSSRKMFEVGKAAAISQTVIGTYESAQKAFTSLAGIPIVGPALGAAAAGAAIAAGMARVQSIRSQSFGGGGAGATATGSNTAAVNAAGTPVGGAPQQDRVMRVEGIDSSSLFSGNQIRGLVQAIDDFKSDGGGRVVMA